VNHVQQLDMPGERAALMSAPYLWLDELVDGSWLGRLSPSALRVLFALGRHTNGRTLESCPAWAASKA